MGHVLPHFGQAINQNMNQSPQYQNYGQNTSNNQLNQYGYNSQGQPYQNQQIQPNFAYQQNMNNQQIPIDPTVLQQQQLNQMIATQNQMISQYQATVASQVQSQLEMQQKIIQEAQKAQI